MKIRSQIVNYLVPIPKNCIPAKHSCTYLQLELPFPGTQVDLGDARLLGDAQPLPRGIVYLHLHLDLLVVQAHLAHQLRHQDHLAHANVHAVIGGAL